MLDKSLSKREFDHQWPWQVVPELSKKQQELSYSDVYKGMTHFMRPTMIFYNHFQDSKPKLYFPLELPTISLITDEPYITAIVALPYTPKMLDQFTAGQLYLIAKTLDMQFTYLSFSMLISHCFVPSYDTPNVVDVVKQKLLDLFYCVEDSKQMHGIVPCQSSFRSCERLASTFCANHMCKECCQVLSSDFVAEFEVISMDTGHTAQRPLHYPRSSWPILQKQDKKSFPLRADTRFR